MGIFQRLGNLFKSNINDMISRAEDPEKMLNQVLVDMRQQLIEAKKQVAVAIADEKRLKKQFEDEQAKVEDWERKAMMAVRAGDDELARQALSRKAEHTSSTQVLEKQWISQKEAVDRLKDSLRALNNKIEEAKRKKNILIARKKRAEAQRTIHQTMSGLQDTSAFETFDRMAAKIDQIEAEAEAGAEIVGELGGDTVERRFAQLEAGAGSDMQLIELKKKMGLLGEGQKSAGALPAGEAEAAGDAGGEGDAAADPAAAVDDELAALKAEIAAGSEAEKK